MTESHHLKITRHFRFGMGKLYRNVRPAVEEPKMGPFVTLELPFDHAQLTQILFIGVNITSDDRCG